jgi:hypothetical protein
MGCPPRRRKIALFLNVLENLRPDSPQTRPQARAEFHLIVATVRPHEWVEPERPAILPRLA